MIESGAGLSPAMVKSLFPRAFGQDVLFAGPAPSGAALVEIGSVKLVVGTVTVRHADGSQEAVRKGAVLYQGDVLVTGAGSFVKAEMRDGTKFQLGQNGEAALDNTSLMKQPMSDDLKPPFGLADFTTRAAKSVSCPVPPPKLIPSSTRPHRLSGCAGVNLKAR